MSEQDLTPAPIKERHEFAALAVRKPKPRALPGSRPLREPKGPCWLCDDRATRLKGDTPLCLRHYKAVNDLVNHGNTSPVTTLMEEDLTAARKETGRLRETLRARYAHRWPDRPIVDWFPVLAE